MNKSPAKILEEMAETLREHKQRFMEIIESC